MAIKNYKSKTPASKETLGKLMDNTRIVIKDMYACLKTEIQILEHMKDSDTKQIRILCQQMCIAVNYSLIDIGVSLRASIGSEKAYEKRFHLKNLKASISESYKLILNFGKARNKSIWTLVKIIETSRLSCEWPGNLYFYELNAYCNCPKP